LSAEQQATVATWAAVKAVVAEYEDPKDTSVHHMHRKRFLNRKRPREKGWTVWLGYHPRQTLTPTYAIHSFLFLRPEQLAKRFDSRATHYNGSITTQVIGELFIQVSHPPKPFRIENLRFDPLPDGGVIRRIWPPNNFSIVWPPSTMSE
jgi:hypothetical protein